eukprot:COSAG05_NODE_6397_length_967_cov_0.789171_2_plen_134_part_00
MISWVPNLWRCVQMSRGARYGRATAPRTYGQPSIMEDIAVQAAAMSVRNCAMAASASTTVDLTPVGVQAALTETLSDGDAVENPDTARYRERGIGASSDVLVVDWSPFCPELFAVAVADGCVQYVPRSLRARV